MGKRLFVGAVIAAVATFGTGGAAVAGERNGVGDATPVNDYIARSLCAFSGLDDMDFESPVEPGVVQNWGAIVAESGGHLGGANSVLTPFGEEGCNAHMYPGK